MMLGNAAEIKIKRLDKLLSKQEEVVLAYLFGSSSPKYQGFGLKKDIDIALLVDKDQLNQKGWLPLKSQLKEKICEVLGRDDVDVVFLNTSSLGFRQRVLREGTLLYQKSEEERVHFETRQITEYIDWEPYERMFAESTRNYFLNHP